MKENFKTYFKLWETIHSKKGYLFATNEPISLKNQWRTPALKLKKKEIKE